MQFPRSDGRPYSCPALSRLSCLCRALEIMRRATARPARPRTREVRCCLACKLECPPGMQRLLRSSLLMAASLTPALSAASPLMPCPPCCAGTAGGEGPAGAGPCVPLPQAVVLLRRPGGEVKLKHSAGGLAGCTCCTVFQQDRPTQHPAPGITSTADNAGWLRLQLLPLCTCITPPPPPPSQPGHPGQHQGCVRGDPGPAGGHAPDRAQLRRLHAGAQVLRGGIQVCMCVVGRGGAARAVAAEQSSERQPWLAGTGSNVPVAGRHSSSVGTCRPSPFAHVTDACRPPCPSLPLHSSPGCTSAASRCSSTPTSRTSGPHTSRRWGDSSTAGGRGPAHPTRCCSIGGICGWRIQGAMRFQQPGTLT